MTSPTPTTTAAPTTVIAPGHTVRFPGLTTTYRVLSTETTSAAVLEHILAPGCLGAPPHRHEHEDEISCVLEGSLTVWQDGGVQTAQAGDVVLKPRGILHTFWNEGSTPVRFLEVIAPATGFERYFSEVAPLIPDNQPPNIPALIELAGRYGLTFEMDLVPALLEQHQLRM